MAPSRGFGHRLQKLSRLVRAPCHYELSGGIINFIFDNVDLNIHTLTGLGTWHAMGGLACSTPCNPDKEERLLLRSTKVRSAAVLGILPFINLDPTDLSTIYSALKYAP